MRAPIPNRQVGRHRVRLETAEPVDAHEPLGAFLQTAEIQQTADEYVDVRLYLDPGAYGADAAGKRLGALALRASAGRWAITTDPWA